MRELRDRTERQIALQLRLTIAVKRGRIFDIQIKRMSSGMLTA